MRSFRYYWERRKVVARALKNWLLWLLLEPLRKRVGRGEEAVVFVSMNARGRVFNHADVLRRRGVRTILLTRVFDYRFQRGAFDEVHVFPRYASIPRQVERIARRVKVLAVVGTNQPCVQGRVLLEMRREWPVIIDPYDSLWALSYFADLSAKEMQALTTGGDQGEVREEEGLLRGADAVTARLRPVEMLLAREAPEKPVIRLEDGCNPRFFVPVEPRNGPKGKEWSVAYAGIFYPMSADPRVCGDIQLVPLGKLFAEEGIHFHLYPSPHHDYAYPEYEEEMARNPYFHLHRSVPFGRVHRELAKHDLGWYALDFRKAAIISEVYRRHLVSLKFFTYLEAGLPVMVTDLSEFPARVVRESGGGLVLGTDAPRGLRRILETGDAAELRRGVERAREMLSVDHRGGDLLAAIASLRAAREASARCGRAPRPVVETVERGGR